MKKLLNFSLIAFVTVCSLLIVSSYKSVFIVQADEHSHHPSPTPTRRPSATPTPTRRPSPTPTRHDDDCDEHDHHHHDDDDCRSTSTPTPTRRPSPTSTSTPTVTPTLSPTNTSTPTVTPTVTPTAEITPTETPVSTPTPTVTGTQSDPTPTPTSSPSNNNDNNGGNGGSSDNHSAPSCNDADPGAPQNLRVTALGGGKVRLDWNHSTGPHTSYAVAYGPSVGNYLYGDPNVGNVTTYTVSALNPGGKYCFYVQAQNGCKGGVPSNVVCSNQGSGSLRILGASDNFNPLVAGIRESYGGVLGASTELAATGEVVYSTSKLPSGNILDNTQSLSIPSINLSQPIYLPQKIGGDLTVGHNEVLRDGSLYYGHNGFGIFSSLYKVSKGDKVITTQNGVVREYQVTDTLFVDKSQVDAIKTSQNQIALMTCSVTYPDSRIIVKASLIK